MDDKFAKACNAVEYISEDVRKHTRKRIFAVVDGRNREFQRELDRLGLTRVKECSHYKDHRTNCYLRFFKVRPEDGDAFQRATEALAEHMPALGYPDYEDYAVKVLVEFDCISPEAVREQTGRDLDGVECLPYNPEAVFNCAGLRMEPHRGLLWQDFVVVEGREKEGRRLLEERGFTDLDVKNPCSHRDWPQYVMFSCTVPKKRYDEFIEVMRELEKRMLICGYRDYEQACAAYLRLLRKMANDLETG